MYSAGFSIDEIREEYKPAIPNFLKGWEVDTEPYIGFLNVLSLSTLLYMSGKLFKEIAERLEQSEAHSKNKSVSPDRLLWFLLNAHLEEKRPLPDNIAYSKHRSLVKVTTLEGAEASSAMKTHLERWYDLNKDAPWHGNHTREWGYSGYWAWEAAAVTKIMGLDDSSFRDNPYYPSDMVHWHPPVQ